MNIIALTETGTWFAKSSNLPQLDLNSISREVLSKCELVLMCPEKDQNPKVHEIIKWKRLGYLPTTHLCFASYKGVHYWQRPYEEFVERWVVHSNSESQRFKTDRFTFIPLSLESFGIEGVGDGQYIFCGGTKLRDFKVAAQAVAATKFEAYFVSGDLPAINEPNIHCTYEHIHIKEYRKMLAGAWLNLIPLVPSLESHGHSDLVRSLVAGRPVIVTKGASCDDYVIHGVNGYIVENTVSAWTEAINKAWFNREALTLGAKNSAAKYSIKLYNQAIQEMINDIISHPKIPRHNRAYQLIIAPIIRKIKVVFQKID